MTSFSSALGCLSILFTQKPAFNAQAGQEMVDVEELATLKGDYGDFIYITCH